MPLFQKEVLLLNSEQALRDAFGADLTADQLRQALCSKIFDVSFSEDVGTHRCVAVALPKRSANVLARSLQFEELAFFGDSQQCLDLALASAKQAEKIIVIGTRSRENVSRMTQHYLRRLCGPQIAKFKRLSV